MLEHWGASAAGVEAVRGEAVEAMSQVTRTISLGETNSAYYK